MRPLRVDAALVTSSCRSQSGKCHATDQDTPRCCQGQARRKIGQHPGRRICQRRNRPGARRRAWCEKHQAGHCDRLVQGAPRWRGCCTAQFRVQGHQEKAAQDKAAATSKKPVSPTRSAGAKKALKTASKGTTAKKTVGKKALSKQTTSAAKKRTASDRSTAAKKAAKTKGPAVRKAAAKKAAATRKRAEAKNA